MLKASKLKQEGKTDQAIALLEKAVSLDPRNHRALNAPAWTLIDLNIDLDKGIKYAEAAVNVFPESPFNNGTLGCGYYKKADLVNAEKYLSNAVRLFPIYCPENHEGLLHDKSTLEAVREQLKNRANPI